MNMLITAIRGVINTYTVTVSGAYPYAKVSIAKQAIFDYRGVNPVGPPAVVDMPIDVFVEVVAAMTGYWSIPHEEVLQTVQAVLWAKANS